MKHYREELTMHTGSVTQIVCITPQVRQAVRQPGIRQGLCLVNSMHITSSVFINDNESGL